MAGGRCHALLIICLLLSLLGTAGPARAVNPETLLMPGKLSSAHEKYEEQCSNCHDRSDRNRQTQLCLDCHKDIAADVRDRHGFHGRMPNAGAGKCIGCHTEHLGRDGDIVRLFTRHGHDWTERYPAIAGAAAIGAFFGRQLRSRDLIAQPI